MNFTTLNPVKHLVTLGRPLPKRLNIDKYHRLKDTIGECLRRHMKIPSSNFGFVSSFVNRSDFGDIDLIILKSQLGINWEKNFAYRVCGNINAYWAHIPNTDTTVFEFEGSQLNVHSLEGDLDDLTQALAYLSNQGSGVILSVLSEEIGLEYTSTGMYLKTGLDSVPRLTIPNNVSTQQSLLGISSDYLRHYIYTSRDLFTIVSRSAYFNRGSFFALENSEEGLAKINASPILREFILWLKANTDLSGEIKFDKTSAGASKLVTVSFSSLCPNVITTYRNLVKTNKLTIMVNTKFNSELVEQITGLKGEVLIGFMKSFTESFKTSKDFNLFIMSSLPETISKELIIHRNATIKVEDIPVQEEVDLVELPPLETKPKARKSRAKPKAEVAVELEVKPKAKPRGKKVIVTGAVSMTLPPTVTSTDWLDNATFSTS